MKKLTAHLRMWAMVAISAGVIVAAMGVGGTRSNRKAVLAPDRNEFIFSATEIIRLPGGNPQTNSDIARLDTRTGAIYRYRGNVDNASARGSWEIRVPPVKEATSGLLEVQNLLREPNGPADPVPPPVTFLVDIVYGTTWILHERASRNASWDLVGIYKYSD